MYTGMCRWTRDSSAQGITHRGHDMIEKDRRKKRRPYGLLPTQKLICDRICQISALGGRVSSKSISLLAATPTVSNERILLVRENVGREYTWHSSMAQLHTPSPLPVSADGGAAGMLSYWSRLADPSGPPLPVAHGLTRCS